MDHLTEQEVAVLKAFAQELLQKKSKARLTQEETSHLIKLLADKVYFKKDYKHD